MISVKPSRNSLYSSASSSQPVEETKKPQRNTAPIASRKSGKTQQVPAGFKSESGIPTGAPNTSVGFNQVVVDTSPMLNGIAPRNDAGVLAIYKDIYYNDPVAGAAADLMSSLPFSEFTLGGFSDRKISNIYHDNIERLNSRTLLPELSIDYLVSGSHVSTLLYDQENRNFKDIMCYDAEQCSFQEVPLYSQDPLITVNFADTAKFLSSSTSPRINKIKEMMGQSVVDTILKGQVELEPLTTLYIPRRTFSSNQLGTSYYKRILPLYLIEKNLYRGTLMESARRQRGIMHITAGEPDVWDPTEQDLELINELFLNADSDPLGAIITTKLGISIEEVRQGGDFWKVTEFQDSVQNAKYHALGISDGLLSGEASYNCVIGSTYIQTEKGIRQIKDIADRKNGKVQDYTEFVNSRYGRVRAAKWLYSGKAPVFKVTADSGNTLTGTFKHRILTLSSTLDLDWTYVGKLEKGDLLAIQTKPCVRTSKLKLKLSDPVKIKKGVKKTITKPTTMTEDLAFLMGALVAEGSINNQRISFPNSDRKFLEKFARCVESVFGVVPGLSLKSRKGTKHTINGVKTKMTMDHYVCYLDSKTAVTWLSELGQTSALSYDKVVPWSILQADEACQQAFLGGLIEGDGTVKIRSGKISLISASPALLEGVQVMIQAMGFNCRVKLKKNIGILSLPVLDSYHLHQAIGKHLVSKTFDYEGIQFKNANKFGIPASYLKEFLKSRNLGFCNKGNSFVNDDGDVILINGYKKFPDKTFLYDGFDEGKYDTFLANLKKISKSFHEKLMHLVKLRYKFTPVVSVVPEGTQDVYDLSMNPFAEPAYVANSLISHNTADASLSVFIDMLRTYREMITRKVFYNKLFPLISVLNGFVVNSKGKVVQKDLLSSFDGNTLELTRKYSDGSQLLIPTVNWSKQLKPEGDSAYFEMLSTLSEKGVPVPLRVLAAAGGQNVEELLRQADDDLDLRKRVAEYAKRVADLAPKPAEGADGYDSESSDSEARRQHARAVLASVDPTGTVRSAVLAGSMKKAPPLLNRNYGEASEVVGRSRTGKRKYIPNQIAENRKINTMIARSAANLGKSL